ncbi:restriction endonuclease subunit S [Aliidiomarina maris]|uniref:Restriction endonuclease subunit S n=1 Tax=Aliidiomarina maris TaxID=531312 RepID=A0A327WZ03_9GAMM|nr:restriction endonuclease subunit S [Aliidiomarina maris]RAJ97088.1 type I restriction modification DNA specificity protein [Aliidiomarina maris]RUO24688.1 restriction endonuclease subunit S [Aliidiomarina maris]
MTKKITSNIVPLGSIADVRMGFTFRESICEAKHGNTHIIQLKDTRQIWDGTQSTVIQVSDLPQISWQGKDKAFLQVESILLPSKGSFLKAFQLDPAQASLPIVVSSQFLVITVKESYQSNISTDFLCWLLNEPETQRALLGESQGTNIRLLKASAVKQVHVPIPARTRQNEILHLNSMWEKEKQLTHALLANRETMMKGLFQQLLKETN